MKKFAWICFVFLTACGPGEPTSENIHEILLEPENLQEFAYADFGPAIMTYMQLGKPTPFGGVKEKTDAGWPVGNIRVLVTAESYKEPHLIFLEEEGRLKPEYDYRVIWYYQAIPLLDEVLGSADVSENMKKRVRQTRAKIIAEMGSEDEVRKRMADYRKPLEKHIREHELSSEIQSYGRKIMEKGCSR